MIIEIDHMVPVAPYGRKRCFDYYVAESNGWKWIRFKGIPIRGTPDYPKETTVRLFVSPKTLASKRWKEHWNRVGGYTDADGTEPLDYCYCSSCGPEFVPESDPEKYPAEWKEFLKVWAMVLKREKEQPQ